MVDYWQRMQTMRTCAGARVASNRFAKRLDAFDAAIYSMVSKY